MSPPPRPRRQRKGDRLVHPGARQDEVRCDYALAPFDRRSREADRVWGIDRLPELVPPDLAEKYGRAIAGLNDAIESNDPEKVARHAASCIRGIDALEKAAIAAGHQPATGEIWQHEIDGWAFGILRYGCEWQKAAESNPGLRLFTMREVGLALKALKTDTALHDAVVKHFPGAEIVRIGAKAAKPAKAAPHPYDDPIPF